MECQSPQSGVAFHVLFEIADRSIQASADYLFYKHCLFIIFNFFTTEDYLMTFISFVEKKIKTYLCFSSTRRQDKCQLQERMNYETTYFRE